MQQDVNKLFKQMDGDISVQKEAFKADIKQQVSRLAELKKDKQLTEESGDERSNIIDNIIFEEEEPVVKPKRSSAKKDSRKPRSDDSGDGDGRRKILSKSI